MNNTNIELTKAEETILEVFWDSGKELTSMDICDMATEFNYSYIHRILTSLENKGILKVVGTKKSGKQYARIFSPTISREEYASNLVSRLGINDKKNISKFVAALISTNSDNNKASNDELITELEDIINSLKNNTEG